MKFPTRAITAGLLLAASNLAFAPALHAQDSAAPATEASAPEAVWYFEETDVPVDPGYVFGRLDNGMRYILRQNATPQGTALVRMRIDSGSLDEADSERGLSHYLEHMAFNGSANIPEGEMIALLEREGLAFGADTNASTSYDAITYMLNLPRNDEALLGTALMLMRETASELTIAEDAVARERGVILAERRDRRNFAQRAQEDALEFLLPGARFIERQPIGSLEVLETATAAQLRALYERTYTPANTVLVIVGDFPVEVMEAAIRDHFTDWTAAPAPVEPETGPVDITRKGLTDIYLDPALSESVSITTLGSWIDEPDTLANRETALLRSIGYSIIARRIARLTRAENAPFRGAGYGESDISEDARAATISIASEDGKWREGMLAAVRVVNEALTHGFTRAEIDEQVANIRTAFENRVASAETFSHDAFAGGALALVSDDVVPTTPQFSLELFNRLAERITPESVFATLKQRALPLDAPLIRFQGRSAPEGGEPALRAAFSEALALPIAAPDDVGAAAFAYTDFGDPGVVVSDTREGRLGFRYITFANRVRLTLKQTDIRKDRVSFEMSVDGGALLNTQDDPLRTYLVSSLPAGGLGQHSADELQSVLAGRSVGVNISPNGDVFRFAGGTTARDLDLQLQLLAAALTDPGYRPEGIEQFRRGIDNFFATLTATPDRALGSASGAILSDGDPRFSLRPREDFLALDFARLAAAIEDRFDNGAIELALVGDLDEAATIAAVASTLGALPMREADFLPREEARQRSFTAARGEHVLRHQGEPDQALLRLVWPTTDDSDFAESLRVALLARVIQIELTERLREELGQAYSPDASSSMSRIYPGYGTFTITASVEASQVEAARAAITQLITETRAQALKPDVVERARQPLLEAYDNALKSLGGWMNLADRAQSESARLERWFAGPETLKAITTEDLQATARKYLLPDGAVVFVVLPETTSATPPGE